jgi:death-on-curing protein
MSGISKKVALNIHEMQIDRHGGMHGLRDDGMLESALAQPFASFGGEDLYPSIEEKAARFAFGIVSNHPFADGNKRTGTQLMIVYMRANGYRFKPRHKDLESIILDVAAGAKGYDDLVAFVRANSEPE